MPYLEKYVMYYEVPKTIFCKGLSSIKNICLLNCETVGLDWTMNIPVRTIVGEKDITRQFRPMFNCTSSKNIEKKLKNY